MIFIVAIFIIEINLISATTPNIPGQAVPATVPSSDSSISSVGFIEFILKNGDLRYSKSGGPNSDELGNIQDLGRAMDFALSANSEFNNEQIQSINNFQDKQAKSGLLEKTTLSQSSSKEQISSAKKNLADFFQNSQKYKDSFNKLKTLKEYFNSQIDKSDKTIRISNDYSPVAMASYSTYPETEIKDSNGDIYAKIPPGYELRPNSEKKLVIINRAGKIEKNTLELKNFKIKPKLNSEITFYEENNKSIIKVKGQSDIDVGNSVFNKIKDATIVIDKNGKVLVAEFSAGEDSSVVINGDYRFNLKKGGSVKFNLENGLIEIKGGEFS